MGHLDRDKDYLSASKEEKVEMIYKEYWDPKKHVKPLSPISVKK
jgi:hypothetical protein